MNWWWHFGRKLLQFLRIDGSIKGQNMKFNGIIIFQGCNLVQGNIICVLPLMINNECINMGRIGTWMHNIEESIESRHVDASPTTHEWVRLYKILGDTILEWVAKAGYMTNYWLAMLRTVLFSSKKFPLVSQSPPLSCDQLVKPVQSTILYLA